MPRRATGSVRYRPGKDGSPGAWWGRITCNDGSRPWEELGQWPNSPQGRARAQETAAGVTERFRALGIVAVPQRGQKARALGSGEGRLRHTVGQQETFDEYAKRWFVEREERGLSSLSTDRSRVRVHVSPILGSKPMRDVTAADLRAVCAHLDRTARTSTEFSWSTGVKVWGLVTKLFADACASKVEALRVLESNPCSGVRGPDRGTLKSKQWLRPRELLALVSCSEVPLRWRRLYALASYLYLRPGELAALEWSDVHLDEGYATIHQSINLETGELKATKTGTSRRVPIRDAILPLLRAMRDEVAGKGRVIQNTHENKRAEHGMPPTEDLAATLREHLERAEVERAELYADRPTTKRITFYDLRASGITWEVLIGTEHVRIQQRAGHANFNTTQGYIREAEALGEKVGEPFGPLPPSLLGTPRDDDSAVTGEDSEGRESEDDSSDESSSDDLLLADPAAFLPDPLASPRGFEPLLQP
jgi:integrase